MGIECNVRRTHGSNDPCGKADAFKRHPVSRTIGQLRSDPDGRRSGRWWFLTEIKRAALDEIACQPPELSAQHLLFHFFRLRLGLRLCLLHFFLGNPPTAQRLV